MEKDAERMVRESGPRLGLPMGAAELADLGKGDERKALLAALLRRRCHGGGLRWVSNGLPPGCGWGYLGSASRQVDNVKRDGRLENQGNELDKML